MIATFSGKSATNLVTVAPLVTTLIHRYSFTSDASDSVGTANGTVYYSDPNNANFVGGQLFLTPSYPQDYNYVDFGPNTISSNDAITFEAWAKFHGHRIILGPDYSDFWRQQRRPQRHQLCSQVDAA